MYSLTENLSHAITGPASSARTVYARETPVSATPSYRNSGYK
jgi:hypothetical protein